MKVEAIKVENGFLIPMTEAFKRIRNDRILLEIEILDSCEAEDYAALDGLIGMCETKRTDASVNQDESLGSEIRESREKARKTLEKLRKTAAVGDVLSPIGEEWEAAE
jgi:hypothetical protein